MFLAFHLSDIVTIPFGYILSFLYQVTSNYGVALILFTIIVKLVLLPASAKGKKNMMKMSRLSPLLKKIQERYPDDQMKQQQAMNDLYKREGVSMTGGCLWSMLPLLILFPLYAVVRQPITYMLHETAEVAAEIVNAISNAAPGLLGKNSYYHQMAAASRIPEFAEAIKAAVPNVAESTLQGVNFSFFGIDLGSIPSYYIFAWDKYDWAHIGAFLLPCLSAGIQVLSMVIMNKLNASVVTDERGIQDAEAAKATQNAQGGKTMMYMMPLMSLFIGFTIPAALSLYWIAQGVVGIVQDAILTVHYRKIYDEEDAVRMKRAMELDQIEAEKERIRAERRAANPDGITENTSKKKIQKQQQQAEEAAKAAAAKAYAARKGIQEEDGEENTALSGIPDRPFCKGRAYDPNRYKRPEE